MIDYWPFSPYGQGPVEKLSSDLCLPFPEGLCILGLPPLKVATIEIYLFSRTHQSWFDTV